MIFFDVAKFSGAIVVDTTEIQNSDSHTASHPQEPGARVVIGGGLYYKTGEHLPAEARHPHLPPLAS